MLISSIGLLAILVPLLQSGLQPSFAIGALSLIGILGLFTLPHQYVGRVLMTATIVAISSLLVDLFVPINRIQAESSILHWAIALTLIVLMVVYFGREFVGLDIRTKVVLGILATGGTALSVFVLFSANQTQQVTSILSNKLETSVSHLAEEQLTNKVGTLAEQANQSFNDVRQDVESLAQNWTSLQEQKQILSQGTYWDARKQLTNWTVDNTAIQQQIFHLFTCPLP